MSSQNALVVTGAVSVPVSALAGACTPLTIHFSVAIDHATALTGTASGGAKLFSNAACSTALTTLTSAAGTSSMVVYLQDTLVEQVSGSLSVEGSAYSYSIRIAAVDTMRIVITPPNVVHAGDCAAFTLAVVDSLQHRSGADVPVTVSVSSGTTYSDVNCWNAATSFTVPGSKTQTVYFRATNSGAHQLNANAASGYAVSGSISVSLAGAAATQLVMRSGATAIVAGECRPYVFSVNDTFGNATTTDEPATIDLTGTAFYSDATCATPTLTVPLAAGATGATAYYMYLGAQGATLTLRMSAPQTQLLSGSFSVTVTALPSQYARLRGVPAYMPVSTCQGPFTVSLESAVSTALPQSVARVIGISSGGSGALFSDAGCMHVATSVTIPINASTATFYVLDSKTENLRLASTDSTGFFAGDSATVTVVVPATRVSIPNRTSLRYQCAVLGVGLVGEYDSTLMAYPQGIVNPAVNVALTATGSGAFYSDAACLHPITSVSVSTSVSVYVRDSQLESITVHGVATGTNLTSATATVTLQRGYIGRVSGAVPSVTNGNLSLGATALGNTEIVSVVYSDSSAPAGTLHLSDTAGNTYRLVAGPYAIVNAGLGAHGSSQLSVYMVALGDATAVTTTASVSGGGSPIFTMSGYQFYGVDSGLSSYNVVGNTGNGNLADSGGLAYPPSAANDLFYAAGFSPPAGTTPMAAVLGDFMGLDAASAQVLGVNPGWLIVSTARSNAANPVDAQFTTVPSPWAATLIQFPLR